MIKYDYYLAGRWRNHSAVRKVLEAVRKQGNTVFCFIENEYKGNSIIIDTQENIDAEGFMSRLEQLNDWQTNPTFREIFEKDMNGLKESREFIMVLPAGLSSHMELGVAYGLGKKCYAIGKPDKHETLYLMFDGIYSDVSSFLNAKAEVRV
ncbi:MAG TPA: hypothetical protein VLF90_02985 [Patescibacteria group bacterium]|nr:hypothetical protein [Patescibacteria group bacterium]